VLAAGTRGGRRSTSRDGGGFRTDNVGTDQDPVEEISDFTESESVRVVTESTFPDVRFDPTRAM
jgi:hypothetical protein